MVCASLPPELCLGPRARRGGAPPPARGGWRAAPGCGPAHGVRSDRGLRPERRGKYRPMRLSSFEAIATALTRGVRYLCGRWVCSQCSRYPFYKGLGRGRTAIPDNISRAFAAPRIRVPTKLCRSRPASLRMLVCASFRIRDKGMNSLQFWVTPIARPISTCS